VESTDGTPLRASEDIDVRMPAKLQLKAKKSQPAFMAKFISDLRRPFLNA
jgi:hypothetical protein